MMGCKCNGWIRETTTQERERDAKEAWRNIKEGDEVIIRRGISSVEKTLIGKCFRVLRMDATHGYCVVDSMSFGGPFHVHPEALEVVS